MNTEPKEINDLLSQVREFISKYKIEEDNSLLEQIKDTFRQLFERVNPEQNPVTYYEILLIWSDFFESNQVQKETYHQILAETENAHEAFDCIRLLAYYQLSQTYLALEKTAQILIEALCSIPILSFELVNEFPEAFKCRATIEKELGLIYIQKDRPDLFELHFLIALSLMKCAAEAYPEKYVSLYMEYAEMLGAWYVEELEFKKGTQIYREMKQIAQLVKNPLEQCEFMKTAIEGINYLGTAYGESGMEVESLELFLEAMNDFWNLSDVEPKYLNDVGKLQSNIGYLYTLFEEYEKADDILEKALGTYQYIRSHQVEGYQPSNEADVYVNIAVMHMNSESYKAGKKALKKASKIYTEELKNKTLSNEKREEIIAAHATALNNLSALYRSTGNFLQGYLQGNKSFKLRKKLCEINPKNTEYQNDLTDSYLNIANNQALLAPWNAIKNLKRVIQIREKLAEADPDRYLEGLADALYNLVTIYDVHPVYAFRKNEEKLKYSLAALGVYSKLKKDNSVKYTHERAEMYATAGISYKELKKTDHALPFFVDALNIYHEIKDELNQEQWQKMIECTVSLMYIYWEYKEIGKARSLYYDLRNECKGDFELYRKNIGSYTFTRITQLAQLIGEKY